MTYDCAVKHHEGGAFFLWTPLAIFEPDTHAAQSNRGASADPNGDQQTVT
jgi:hypothetical protein